MGALTEMPDRAFIFNYWWAPSLVWVAVMLLLKMPYRSSSDFLVWFVISFLTSASIGLVPFLARRSALSNARRMIAERSDLAESRSFTSEGFLSAPAWAEPVPWSFVTKVVETKHFFFVYHSGSHGPEYVPKTAMTNAEITRLRELLRKQAGSQSTQLKLYATASRAAGPT